MKWFCSLFAIRTSPITHNLPCLIPHPPPPKKKRVTLVFHFSWVLQPSQEKLKTMPMQNWGQASWGILGDVRVADV